MLFGCYTSLLSKSICGLMLVYWVAFVESSYTSGISYKDGELLSSSQSKEPHSDISACVFLDPSNLFRSS
jgi:hypothetical protein